jgi:hypothetical protein
MNSSGSYYLARFLQKLYSTAVEYLQVPPASFMEKL